MNGHESSTDSSNELPGTKVGREERIVIQNEVQVYRPALQNGLVPKTSTERRKAFRGGPIFKSSGKSKIKTLETPKLQNSPKWKRNMTPQGSPLLPSLPPAYLILLSPFVDLGCQHGICEVDSATLLTSSYSSFPTWSHLMQVTHSVKPQGLYCCYCYCC